jgi:acetylglutamate kinase
MEKYIEKAGILVEALPYIKKFSGIDVVIKYGGSTMKNGENSIVKDISFLDMVNIFPIVVHGGGPAINRAMEKANITPQFKNGLRVTDQEGIKIAESVLSGEVNKSIVSEFQKYGIKSVGISGKDGMLLEAKKSPMDIGFVGDIIKVNPQLIYNLKNGGFVPIVSPISTDTDANTYNVNADYVAVEIAIALKATKLIFLTDIDGVMEDPSKPESLIPSTNPRELRKLIDKGIIRGGMIPKVEACIKAVTNGVESVHMINANVEHVLLLEIFTDKGIGTMINNN